MKKSRVLSATLLVVSSVGIVSGAGAAAPVKACASGDKLVAASTNTLSAAADLNGNGVVCDEITRYHAPKKPGPGTDSHRYYDDVIV